MIQRWCRNWGLQEADALDVRQNVLLAISQQMQTFEYRSSGRFRAWLKTIAYRAWCRFLETRRRSRLESGGSEAVIRMLESTAARDDFLRELDRECERNILNDAMAAVKTRVESHSWDAFWRTAMDGTPAVEAAKALEMTVVAVYQSRSRIQKMIQQEVRMLEQFND